MTDAEDPLEDVDVQSATAESVDHDAVRAALAHDQQTVVRRAVAVCEVIAADDLAGLDPFLEDLAWLLVEGNEATAHRAAGLLFAKAKEEPSAFTEYVDDVTALLSYDVGGHRMLGANILAKVVVEDPDAVRPHLDEVVAGLETVDVNVSSEIPEDATIDTPGTTAIQQKDMEESQLRIDARNKLVNVLVAVVEDDPAAAADHAPDIGALVDHDDAVVVAHAIDALAEYAQVDPGLVEPHVEDLVDRLDHWDEVVRARAIRALGFAEAEEAAPALRSVAEDDDEEDVRALAAETAEYLKSA